MTHPAPDEALLPLSKDGIIRRSFGLKDQIQDSLARDYHSDIVKRIRENDHTYDLGRFHFRLAKDFGFCYGVDKAIDFAYETRRRFPDRRIWLTDEIIHNPRVNTRCREMGIRFINGPYADGATYEDIRPEDVVLIPAFGVDVKLLDRLKAKGCVIVDSTCGSVVHVWKRVERYAREGFTSIIHGKWKHEETIATASHVTMHEGGHYLIVFDKNEAQEICDFIRNNGDAEEAARLGEKYRNAKSEGFDFNQHLAKVGCANQTTMLSSESLEIGRMVRQALVDRYGGEHVEEHYRSFDTICHATQERQDAVIEMMQNPPDIMIVVGGFNSSNTEHLAEICEKSCPTYHVDSVECLISPQEIKHRPAIYGAQPVIKQDWLPAQGKLTIGITAGASTPNRVIGEVIERMAEWEETPA
jgi:4-hydroxy-3-methylbut-2-enyl diphosphate reductase